MKKYIPFERFARARLIRGAHELLRSLKRFETREDDPEAVHELRVTLRRSR